MPNREDRGIAVMRGVAANDDPDSEAGSDIGASGGAEARIDDAVMRIARLLGRQIARERFRQAAAANDNAPEKDAGDG